MSTSRAEAQADEMEQADGARRNARTPTLVGLPPARAPMETLRELPNLPRSRGPARRKTPLPISDESRILDESTPISSVRVCPPRLRTAIQSDFSDTVVEPLPELFEAGVAEQPAASLDFAPTVADPNVAPLPAELAAKPVSYTRELAPRMTEERTAIMEVDALTRLQQAAQPPVDELTDPMVEIRIEEPSTAEVLTVRPHPLPPASEPVHPASEPEPSEDPNVARAPAGLVVWPPAGGAIPDKPRKALQSWTKLTRRPVPASSNMSWSRPAPRPPEPAIVGVRFMRLFGYLIMVTLAAIVVVQMLSVGGL